MSRGTRNCVRVAVLAAVVGTMGACDDDTSPDAEPYSAAAYCAVVEPVLGADGLDPSDPAEGIRLLRQTADQLASVTPPPDLRDAHETVRDAYARIADLADDLDLSSRDAWVRLASESDRLSATVEPAEQEIESWVAASCGSGSSTDAGPGTGAEPVGSADGAVYVSPDGDVLCTVLGTAGEMGCYAPQITDVPECSTQPGAVLLLPGDGGGGRLTGCLSDAFTQEPVSVPAGSVVEIGVATCTFDAEEVSCTSSGGHGVSVSGGRYYASW